MSIKMKELPESERPYEKMEMYGSASLSNSELLAIIIKCGTKEDTSVGLAQKILKLKGISKEKDLSFLQELSIEELTQIKGIGKVKAARLNAFFLIIQSNRISKIFHYLLQEQKGRNIMNKLFIDNKIRLVLLNT